MTSNLWIGRPGGMREISQRATLDRSPTVTVTEHRSLEGQVTTWSPIYTPRRLKIEWKWLSEADARHLGLLAQRFPIGGTDESDPIMVVDPVHRNLLEYPHFKPYPSYPPSQMQEGLALLWDLTGGGKVDLVGNLIATISQVVVNSCLWWRNPRNPTKAWPVTGGMTMSFSTDLDKPAGTTALQWLDTAANTISTVYATARNTPITAVAPPYAAFVRPFVSFNEAGGNLMPHACLAVGPVADTAAPGEGFPQYAITAYTETVPQLPYRDVTIELVEVASAS